MQYIHTSEGINIFPVRVVKKYCFKLSLVTSLRALQNVNIEDECIPCLLMPFSHITGLLVIQISDGGTQTVNT